MFRTLLFKLALVPGHGCLLEDQRSGIEQLAPSIVRRRPVRNASRGVGCSYGNTVSPINHRSHSLAAPRPSLIAHTTRLWPRRMSPAAKTPGMLVANLPCSALTLVRGSR